LFSLLTLGSVIATLAENASKAKKYVESTLRGLVFVLTLGAK
jgi:hypothetical protein